MSDQSFVPHTFESSAAAAYIADIAASLAVMARRQKFDALGYLLEMARLEAEALSSAMKEHRSDPAGHESPVRSGGGA